MTHYFLKPYILTRPYLLPSARLIAQRLGIRATSHQKNYAPAIRWGNSDGDIDYDTETTLNEPSLIAVSSSKRHFNQTMTENGIPCVQYYIRTIPERYPVVIRTIPNGSKGKGIVIARNEKEWRSVGTQHMWSYWYNFSYELGVHILGGKIAKIFKKVREENEEREEFPIRNMERGYSFKLREGEHYPKLAPIIEKFYGAFRINLARLDIAWDAESKVYRIIECNSAPGIAENENTLELYVNYLREALGLER